MVAYNLPRKDKNDTNHLIDSFILDVRLINVCCSMRLRKFVSLNCVSSIKFLLKFRLFFLKKLAVTHKWYKIWFLKYIFLIDQHQHEFNVDLRKLNWLFDIKALCLYICQLYWRIVFAQGRKKNWLKWIERIVNSWAGTFRFDHISNRINKQVSACIRYLWLLNKRSAAKQLETRVTHVCRNKHNWVP